jgi:hypothetical protein
VRNDRGKYSVPNGGCLRTERSPSKGECREKQNRKSSKESIDTTENVNRDEEYLFETHSAIKEIATIFAKTTILHTKKMSIILKAEEDPLKPWYFIHV